MERKRENDKSAADRSLHSLRRRDCEKISGKTFFNHPPIARPHLLRCAGPHYSSLFSSPSENPKGAGSAKTFLNMQIIRNQTDYYSSQQAISELNQSILVIISGNCRVRTYLDCAGLQYSFPISVCNGSLQKQTLRSRARNASSALPKTATFPSRHGTGSEHLKS